MAVDPTSDAINRLLQLIAQNSVQNPSPGFVPSGGGAGAPVYPVPPAATATGGAGSVSSGSATEMPGSVDPTKRAGPTAGVGANTAFLLDYAKNPGYNAAYPAALWGGMNNVQAQTPPQWMVDMVAQYNAMPNGPDKIARYAHIMSFQYPDYLKAYLQSSLGAPGGGAAGP